MALASGSIAEMREICISYLINKKNKKKVLTNNRNRCIINTELRKGWCSL